MDDAEILQWHNAEAGPFCLVSSLYGSVCVYWCTLWMCMSIFLCILHCLQGHPVLCLHLLIQILGSQGLFSLWTLQVNTYSLQRRWSSAHCQARTLIIFLLFCLRRRVPGHRGPPAPTEVRVRFPGAGRGWGGAACESGDAWEGSYGSGRGTLSFSPLLTHYTHCEHLTWPLPPERVLAVAALVFIAVFYCNTTIF